MTKKFDVIPIEDYGIVMDKETKMQVGDNYYNVSINELGRALDTTISQIRYEEEHGIIRHKVIATIGKRVRMWHGEELPLIELPDDPLDRRKPVYMVKNLKGGKEGNLTFNVQLFESLEEAKEWCKPHPHLQIVEEWIVAAQSKGVFSEEDIQKVLDIAQSACNMPHDNDVLISRNFIEQELKNLQKNKLPVAVELEVEYLDTIAGEDQHIVIITNSETNTIKPVEVIWD